MKQKQTIITDSPADILRRCREQSGHRTIYAAGQAVKDISLGTLHRIEHGAQDPTIKCLAGVLTKLGWKLKLVAEKID
jgi:hypothetical protein